MKLKLFKQKIKFLIPLLFMLASVVMMAQSQKTITGKVLSADDNMPLPGASVVVKGTTNGASTDFDGNFTLSVANSATTLTVSYLGYKTKEVAITSGSLTILLATDASALDEIVVVGYGTQKKSDITGSVSKVEMENAIAIPTTNISEMIRGQAAGVQVNLVSARPGGTSDIVIRGRNSIRGGNQPLVVLDGFPIENINDVNPDDITSIEVLKDASAQAIYGARASNGVILITTKKGKDAKVRVSLNSYTTVQKLTKNFDLYSAEEFVKLRREAVRTTNPVVNGVQAYSDDTVNFSSATEYAAFIAGNFVNWEDEVLRTGLINSHTLSVSGGSENTKVFSSANYFDQKGLIPTSGYKRGSFRLNLNQKINDKASIEANLNVSTANQKKETTSLDFVTISPLTGPYDTNGNLVKDLAGANASSSSINPLWNIRESDNDIKTNLYNLNLVANYQFAKSFSYKLNTLLSRRFIDEGQYISKLHSQGVTPNGSATVSNTLREEYLIENIFNYTPEINDNNRMDVTFVQSINQRNSSRTTTDATGFGNDVLGYDGISGALSFKTERNEEQYRLSSFLGRIRYTLMDKYLLTLTGRKDGASVFSENNKWGFFPAASFAWQMHKESFLNNVESINELKLRISYGSVGNQSLDPYTTLGVVDNFPYIFGGAIVGGNLPGTVLPNPNLTWETSTTYNIGLDYGLFKNRLRGSAEYYNTKTTDLLTDISLGGNSGFSSMITNGGETKNSGIELLLTGEIIRNNDLKWSVTGVFTKNRNEITKTGIVDVDGLPKDDLGRNRYAGEPINVYRAYVFDGIFQTDEEALGSPQGTLNGTVTPFQNVSTLFAGSIKLKDENNDGVINDDDRVIVKRDPDWFASISSSVQFKGFELLADLYIVEGAKRYNPYLADFNEGGTITSVRNGIVRDYWTPENPSNTAPRPNYAGAPANISVLGITDASYVRLRTLSLSYNLSQSVLGKLNMNAARLYITGSNLFTITDYKSYSPENNAGDFPDTKSITLGVNITL
ncbi:SusC/RagA family TonB-linked outer membrane protein [Mariniflexile sp.]|uniref:SusC/RagA family TonB-linked outer membrane protein n=1 Tax=Mariniflexile sp. TaxID=1979402 RepID=UPI0040479FE7